jgi:hypothetical protein
MSHTGHGAAPTIFQIMTGENWNNLLYSAIQLNPVYGIFIILTLFIGSYMIMNLFISILLQGIDQDNSDQESSNDADSADSLGRNIRRESQSWSFRASSTNNSSTGKVIALLEQLYLVITASDA